MAKSNKETVKLNRPTKIGGAWVDESAEVYPFQRRHLVDAGYVNGGVEDIASDGEKQAGALEVLKKADKRSDVEPWSVDRVFAENDTASESPSEPRSSRGK